MLAEAASEIGDTQVRNRGTIGGALVKLTLAVTTRGGAGAQRADEMRRHARRTSHPGGGLLHLPTHELESDEILTEIVIPATDQSSAGVYLKSKNGGRLRHRQRRRAVKPDSDGACNESYRVTGGGTSRRKRCRWSRCCVHNNYFGTDRPSWPTDSGKRGADRRPARCRPPTKESAQRDSAPGDSGSFAKGAS